MNRLARVTAMVVVGGMVLGIAVGTAKALDVYYSSSVTGSDYSPAGLDLGGQGYWFANFDGEQANDAPPEESEVNELPTYATQTFGDTIDSAGGWGDYADLTLPDGTTGNSGALEMNNAPGNVAGRQEDYMTLEFGAGVPTNLQLGVVVDSSNGLRFSNSEIIVNGSSTGTLTNNLVPDVHTFDLLGIESGDAVTIEGVSSTASVSHLGGLVLDDLFTLELEVNRGNGMATLHATENADLEITGYEITSTAGSLNTAGWAPFEGTSLGNGVSDDGIDWEQLGDGLSSKIGEYNLSGSTEFSTGDLADMSLGSLFSPGATEDLRMNISLADGSLQSALVSYIGSVEDVDGDYNGDQVVNAADYVLWRNTEGDSGVDLPADGNGDGTVDQADYTYWKDRFGNTSGAGSEVAAVPEPAALAMLLLGTLLLCKLRGRRLAFSMTAAAALLLIGGSAADADVTSDRLYLLGDEPGEGPADGADVGSGNEFNLSFDTVGTSGAGDLQDLSRSGNVTYDGNDTHPGGGSNWSAEFGGGYLSNNRGVGYPGSDPGPNPNADYSGITVRGMQGWVKPTGPGGALQEVINDTYQFGIRITASDTWGMIWGAASEGATDGRAYDSGVAVDFDQWQHVHQHSYGTGEGILYVNGAAAVSSLAGQIYQTAGAGLTELTVGADDLGEDTFTGLMDDLEIYVAGTSTDSATDYGTFNLEEDNGYINSLGLTSGDLTDDGVVDDDDIDVFISNWRSEQLLAGQRIGDINSRLLGDFDYDGYVGLADWQVIRETHADGESLNLGALLASASVPEPGSIAILLSGLGALLAFSRRRTILFSAAMAASLLMFSSDASAADLWNVDFQGDINGTIFTQTGTQKNYGPDDDGIWNHFEVHGLDNDEAQTAFTTDPSLELVDNDGNASSVTVSLTGDYGGWNGDTNPNFLTGDYIILLGSGTLGYPEEPMLMDITGLSPGIDYGLRVITGSESAARDVAVTLDTNGDGMLDDEATVVAPAAGASTNFSFTASGSGSTTATLDLASVNEADVAGIQIKVGDFNPVLAIDRETGQMTLSNNTGESLDVAGYLIESNSVGALDPDAWLSVTDNYDMDSGDMSFDSTSTWQEFTMPGERDNLSEVQDVGGSGATLANGGSLDLGPAWIRNFTEDVTMQMLLDDGTVRETDVRFEGLTPILGDLDFNRSVGLEDWELLKAGFSSDISDLSQAEKYAQGDLNFDGAVNLADVLEFQTAFDAGAGAGAFQLAVSGAIPEPGTLVCLSAVLAGLTLVRLRRPTAA